MSNEITDIKKITLLIVSTGVIMSVNFTWNLLNIVIFASNVCIISKHILIHNVRAMLEYKICFISLVSSVDDPACNNIL